MPIYTFHLMDNDGGAEDPEGANLSSNDGAFEYARGMVHELMRGRELATRSWRVDVYGPNEEWVCRLPFAHFDPTLDHLTPALRERIERLAEASASLKNEIHAARVTIRESRALVARSRGRPYLAAQHGAKVIRD